MQQLEVILQAFRKYEEYLDKKGKARERNRERHKPDRQADLQERLRGH